jgi:hypothetical protein
MPPTSFKGALPLLDGAVDNPQVQDLLWHLHITSHSRADSDSPSVASRP